MIIKSLYLYWTNSDWLWKSEKFFLFLVCMAACAIFNGVMVYWGIFIWGPWYNHPGFLWSAFLTGGLTCAYWIYRWCHYLRLEAQRRMKISTGEILKPERKRSTREERKEAARLAKNEERRIALGFVDSLKK